MPIIKSKTNGPLAFYSRHLQGTPEGRIFLVGFVLAIFFVVFLGLTAMMSTQKGAELWSMAGVRLAAGRSGGLYFGFLQNLGWGWVFGVNVAIEILWILLVAPLAIMAMETALNFRWARKLKEKKEAVKERYGPALQKKGPPALFVFVFLPLPLTGPIMGSLMAQWLNIPVLKNMALVISASLASVAAWAVLIVHFSEWLESFGPEWQWGFFFFLVLISFGIHFIKKMKKSRQRNHEK